MEKRAHCTTAVNAQILGNSVEPVERHDQASRELEGRVEEWLYGQTFTFFPHGAPFLHGL